MNTDPSFVLTIECYEARFYRTVQTAVRGVIGWGSGYPDHIHLYVDRHTRVDWVAFDAWRKTYGVGQNEKYPPAPLFPGYGASRADQDLYEAELKVWDRDCKVVGKALHATAEQDLRAVFI